MQHNSGLPGRVITRQGRRNCKPTSSRRAILTGARNILTDLPSRSFEVQIPVKLLQVPAYPMFEREPVNILRDSAQSKFGDLGTLPPSSWNQRLSAKSSYPWLVFWRCRRSLARRSSRRTSDKSLNSRVTRIWYACAFTFREILVIFHNL